MIPAVLFAQVPNCQTSRQMLDLMASKVLKLNKGISTLEAIVLSGQCDLQAPKIAGNPAQNKEVTDGR